MPEYTTTSVDPKSVKNIYLSKELLHKKERTYNMSYEEFWEWSDEDTHAEWVEGVVTVFMPPLKLHQTFSEFLYSLISRYAQLFELGEIHYAPFQVCIRPNRSYREPDLFFVSQHRLHFLTDKRMEEPPDLIIEIISKESIKRDREVKYHEYQQVGVREYWILDSRSHKRSANLYTLNDQGIYQAIQPDAKGRYRSLVLPGFWFRPSWLKHDPLPDTDNIILEMCGELYAQQVNEKMLRQAGETHAQRMIEQLFAQQEDRYVQCIIAQLVKQEGGKHAQRMNELMLKQEGEIHAQRMIDQLRRLGFLPDQGS